MGPRAAATKNILVVSPMYLARTLRIIGVKAIMAKIPEEIPAEPEIRQSNREIGDGARYVGKTI